jgi:drug/metabolite transporter (DMT)-like permease
MADPHPSRHFQLNFTLLGVMVLWGFNFVALKLLLKDDTVTPATAALARWIIMSAVLVGYCRWRKLPLKYPKSGAWRVHVQGFLAMGVYMVFFTVGMRDTTPAEGAIILGCSPVFTLLLAVFFKQEKFRWQILLGTLLAFVGVALVVWYQPDRATNATGALGNLLIFCSAILWAASAVVSRPLVKETDPVVLTTLAMPAGLIALLPFGLRDFIATDWAHLPAVQWGMLLYFAIGAGAIGFMGFYSGVRQVGAAGAMLYQYFVSPFAVISSWIVLHLGLTLYQFLGLAVVISGVWIASRARSQSLATAAEAA